MVAVQGADQHHEVVDVTTSSRPRVLMVVANPTTSATTGWPVGFWAAERTHSYYEFKRVCDDVAVASPDPVFAPSEERDPRLKAAGVSPEGSELTHLRKKPRGGGNETDRRSGVPVARRRD